jgi:1-acyl-sn-glycerol-3-phosphate acyltransferase
MGGLRTTHQKVDYDYTPYLGPNYKETQKEPAHVSTFCPNHSSWLDIPVMISKFKPAFAAKKALRKIPVFGLIC